MKKLFFTFWATAISIVGFAQSSLVATLSHEGTTTAYYGAEALASALHASSAGDVITLSSGQFNAANITKSVMVRGAGMENGAYGALPTVLQGNFSISADNITLEGIFHNATLSVSGYTNTNVTFIKCRLYSVQYSGGGNAYNNRYIHCKIASSLSNYANSSINLINSVAANVRGSKYNISNCVLLYSNMIYIPGSLEMSTISNSIVYSKATGTFPATDVLAYNVGNFAALWNNSSSSTNVAVDDISALFKDFDGEYTDEVTFQLKDDAAAQYVGNDGTQVGVYGGSMPFDPTPTNPQITKAKVAGKTSADGKLSIELEVNGANN